MTVTRSIIKGGCLLRIQAIYPTLKTAERRLADFIRANPEKAITCTLQDLEKTSGTSYATISRFCRKTGYHGYKAFKQSLTTDVLSGESEAPASGFPIHGQDSIETIIEKTFHTSLKTLEETREILDVRSLERATALIEQATEVYFIGTGTSGVCADYAVTRFFRIGVRCSSETDPTLYKIKTSLLSPPDLLFAISSSGRSANIVDAARTARKRNVSVISLSDFAISPLTRASTVNLYTTPRNTSFFADVDVQLIIGQINILDILLSCVIARLGKKASALYQSTKKVADREKIKK